MAENNADKKDSDNTLSILVVDDHPIVRQGLTELINHEEDLTVSAQADDAHNAMEMIKKKKPDMAIVDISLQGKSGIALIKDITSHYPNLPILALSMHDELLYAERALRAGAKGYIMKQEATDKVITAIRKVLDGQLYVSETMATKMVSKLVRSGSDVGSSPTDCLSDRELEVFMLIGKGYGTRQIAEKLYLSTKTIETYRAHIKEKLSLADAAELLKFAIQWVSSQEKL